MKNCPVLIAICLSLIIAVPATLAVFCYNQPMEELSFDFLSYEEEYEDDNSWKVYENQQGRENELNSDGYSGYTGADSSTQTIYFSKKLPQKLDAPMLEIGTANRSISIFLDNHLIYSDFPELDNRIGWLVLPMLESDREKPLLLSLPPNCQGKTLTIAQSHSGYSEKQDADTTFYPCEVRLYYGYAYESKMIANTSKTMIPTMFFFLLSILLLIVFIWDTFMGSLSFPMFSLALMAVFLMGAQLVSAPFFHQYFEYSPLDYALFFYYLSINGALLFFAVVFKNFRRLLWTLTVLQGISIGLSAITQAEIFVEYGDLYIFLLDLPRIVGFVSLVIACVCVFIQGRRKYPFFIRISKIMLVLAGFYSILLVVSIWIKPDYLFFLWDSIVSEIQWCRPNVTLKYLQFLCMAASILAFSVELIEQKIRYRAENSILTEKNEMAMDSYENLRLQAEETMMLRHDIIRHYTLLQTLVKKNPTQVYEYLGELIGQMKKVRPVVHSGNEILDIIVNGKLALAADKGIATQLVRCEAPYSLPLPDTELCSLIMNILDNAIAGTSQKDIKSPYLKLDFHCNNQHFIFSCENAMASEHEKNVSRQHYGLKIIRKIMEKWGEMVSVETDGKKYRITVAIPLS